MTPLLVALLYFLLYAIIALIILEIVFYVINQFIVIPPKIRQLIYALVGIIFIIYAIQLFLPALPR